MTKIIGRFYFKITSAGNRYGEFSNCGMSGIDSEYVDRPHLSKH